MAFSIFMTQKLCCFSSCKASIHQSHVTSRCLQDTVPVLQWHELFSNEQIQLVLFRFELPVTFTCLPQWHTICFHVYKWQGYVYTRRGENFCCEIGQSALHYGAKINNNIERKDKLWWVSKRRTLSFSNLNPLRHITMEQNSKNDRWHCIMTQQNRRAAKIPGPMESIGRHVSRWFWQISEDQNGWGTHICTMYICRFSPSWHNEYT